MSMPVVPPAGNEPLTSSGEFDTIGPQNREEILDTELFTPPASTLDDDASAEDILSYDPVAESQKAFDEKQAQAKAEQDAAAAAVAPVEPETPVVEPFLDPSVNPPEPTVPETVLQPVAPVVAEPVAPAVPQAPDQTAIVMAQNQALSAQVQQLTAQMTQMQQNQVAPQPQAQPGQPAVPAEPERPQYQYNIAPQLLDAIRSEDANQSAAGLAMLINEAMSTVHSQVRTEMHGYVAEQAPVLAEARMTEVNQRQQAATNIRQDFFGSYPQFGGAATSNALDPVISNITSQVMQELNLPWNEVVKNTVAVRLHTVLGGQHSAAPQTVQPQVGIPVPPVGGPQPAQAALAAQGTRPGGAGMTPSNRLHNEVVDLFALGNPDHPSGSFG